jgi:hypothetical protein
MIAQTHGIALWLGNDLCGLPGRGQSRSGDATVLDDEILQVSARRGRKPGGSGRVGLMTDGWSRDTMTSPEGTR